MSVLRELIGPLETISNEELEEIVASGRLARENSISAPKKRCGGGKKPSKAALDLGDFDDDDFSDFE